LATSERLPQPDTIVNGRAVRSHIQGVIMSQTRLLSLLLVPFLLLLMGFRQAPLVDPPPIAVSPKLDLAQVERAVKQALVKREWLIISDEPGKLVASYDRREFTSRIGIAYDNKQVRVSYITSTGLKYEVKKDGEKLIHKNYMAWIQNLVTDIGNYLTLAGIQ
jgi:hypothetical protein